MRQHNVTPTCDIKSYWDEDEQPKVTNYYVYGLGLLYEITETATGTNTLFYHYDLRGSTVALTDASGNVTDRIEYSAYGLITYRAGTNDTPFLFNGRYGVQTDPNGLLYMRARYYNPYICRFLNPDPIGFAGGLNFYVYAPGLWDAATHPLQTVDALSVAMAEYADRALGGDPEAIGRGVFELAAMAVPVTKAKPVHTFAAVGRVSKTTIQQHVFWSGGRLAEDAARAFARANNGVILGDTAAGRALAEATRDIPWSQARERWLRLSEDFARTASGEVHVFHNSEGVFLNSIWRQEYRVLMENPNVTKINFHVVMPDGKVILVR